MMIVMSSVRYNDWYISLWWYTGVATLSVSLYFTFIYCKQRIFHFPLHLIIFASQNAMQYRLMETLLHNPNQSAFTKHHSTETTLLSLHDHLITAISHQQVTCLCLLDLSAAFYTIDHSNLLHCLSSWFEITDIPLRDSKIQNLLITSLFLCTCLWFCIISLSPFL